jgi:hypothetical protein
VRRLAAFAAITGTAALAACATPPDARGPGTVQTFRGRWVSDFEVSRFEGCWLAWADDARPDVTRLQSRVEADGSYELWFEGTMEGSPRGRGHYGHMGFYPCRITVLRLLDPYLAPPRMPGT